MSGWPCGPDIEPFPEQVFHQQYERFTEQEYQKYAADTKTCVYHLYLYIYVYVFIYIYKTHTYTHLPKAQFVVGYVRLHAKQRPPKNQHACGFTNRRGKIAICDHQKN